MNFDFVTFLILEWKIRCCMVYKFLTVHSEANVKHVRVGGVVGFASKVSKKKRETVDIFRKKSGLTTLLSLLLPCYSLTPPPLLLPCY